MKSPTSIGQQMPDVALGELFHENSKLRRNDIGARARIGTLTETDRTAHKRQMESSFGDKERISLIDPQMKITTSFEDAIRRRRSSRQLTEGTLSAESLSYILQAANGPTGPDSSLERVLLAAPSAGALFPVEVYAALPASNAFGAGLFWYSATTHALRVVFRKPMMPQLARTTFYEEVVSNAAVCIVLALALDQVFKKYGNRGYRFALLEAGHIAQNILLAATAVGLAAVPIGGFVDNEVDDLLSLSAMRQSCVYMIPIGHPAA
jgi:SagB-type dehydrogenase family enzyme